MLAAAVAAAGAAAVVHMVRRDLPLAVGCATTGTHATEGPLCFDRVRSVVASKPNSQSWSYSRHSSSTTSAQ